MTPIAKLISNNGQLTFLAQFPQECTGIKLGLRPAHRMDKRSSGQKMAL